MIKKSTSDYYDSHWAEYADLNYPDAKIEKVKKFFAPVQEQIIKSKKSA